MTVAYAPMRLRVYATVSRSTSMRSRSDSTYRIYLAALDRPSGTVRLPSVVTCRCAANPGTATVAVIAFARIPVA